VSYYGMSKEELQAEILRLQSIQGILDQRARAEVRIGQCKRLLEEK
jgi:hypothetical protein